jgi:8-oxo-dGTP pyrophosphatase MutT (NUDIX family)
MLEKSNEGDDEGAMEGGVAIPQSAVLGYRMGGNGMEILLVTSKTRGRWVLPKGMIAEGMTPAQSAVKEAWEEAGAVGAVTGGCLGIYRYLKTRRCEAKCCVVMVYAMKVTAMLPTWPEQRFRRRRWMGIDEAIGSVADRDLRRLLTAFRARLNETVSPLADRRVCRVLGSGGSSQGRTLVDGPHAGDRRFPDRWRAGEGGHRAPHPRFGTGAPGWIRP